GRLIEAHRNDHIPRRKEAAIVGMDQVQACCFLPLHPFDADSVANRELEAIGVVLKIVDDFAARHEAVGLRALVFGTRQSRLPVWRVERERIPAVIAPSLSRSLRLLKDEMVTPLPGQIVADRKPGLSSAHDDGFYMSAHGLISLARARPIAEPPR